MLAILSALGARTPQTCKSGPPRWNLHKGGQLGPGHLGRGGSDLKASSLAGNRTPHTLPDQPTVLCLELYIRVPPVQGSGRKHANPRVKSADYLTRPERRRAPTSHFTVGPWGTGVGNAGRLGTSLGTLPAPTSVHRLAFCGMFRSP